MKIWPSSFACRADRLAEVVVCAQEPGAIPSVLVDRGRPSARGLADTRAPPRASPQRSAMAASSFGRQHEQPGDEDRLGHAARRGSRSSGTTRRASSEKQLRLRQSFQSARPISGSPCGPSRVERVVASSARRCSYSGVSVPGRVVVRHRLVEDRAVAGLLQVGGDGRGSSHSGSSLKPEPTASLPRLVSGWYWW